MPTISTGNPGWDQNLSTLGNALFPDPSKIGQAYYYGAEARKAQAETNKLTNQQNYGFRFMQMQPDSAQPLAPPTYSQPNLPGLAPIINAPSNLPIAGGPGPGQAAQPPLSSVIPGPAGPAGGQLVPQTMTPQQAAAATPEMFTSHPANQGTPAPTSSPAPGSGAGLAPNTTGSDGSTPSGDPTARGFHPASVTPAGGGMKMSGPADYNGSPARTPVSLATYVATAVQSGMDAAQASLQGQAYLAAMFKQGSIDAHTYHELLAGTGQAAPVGADIAAAGQANVANITQAGEMARQQVVTGESARQFNLTPKMTVGPDGNPVFTPQNQVAGQPAYDSAVAVQRQAQEGAYGNYFDPNKPGEVIHTTAKIAAARGLQEGAKDPNQVNARMIEAIQAEQNPAKQQQMILAYQQMQATPAVMDPQAQNYQQRQEYDTNQQIYTVPQKGVVSFGVKEPVAFDAVADQAINQRAAALALQPENRFMRNDPTKAHEAAINDLQAHPLPDGRRLPTPPEVAQMRIPARTRLKTFGISGDPRIDTRVNPATGAASEHMMLHLMTEAEIAAATGKAPSAAPGAPAAPAPAAPPSYTDPSTPAMTTAPTPTAPAAAPAVSGPPTATTIPQTFSQKLSTIIGGGSVGGFGLPGRSIWGAPAAAAPPTAAAAPATPATPTVSGGAPPGALGPAPAGSIEGQTGRSRSTGQAVVNRGGWLFPAQ